MHTLETFELYTRYHPRWFETINAYVPNNDYHALARNALPDNWRLDRQGLWTFAYPAGHHTASQGWKLHVSSATSAAQHALSKTARICGDLNVAFKFPLDHTVTVLLNGKLWPRGSSGKFVTIYPDTLDLFYQCGEQLAVELKDHPGPYILSDRRWPRSKSVYYRYGGFTAQLKLRADGRRSFTIQDDAGAPTVDQRGPVWNPPAWAKDPFPAPSALEQDELTINNGRYRMDAALSFSNRGGVYKATDMLTDETVLIKEARPNVEVGAASQEAVAVLDREAKILGILSEDPHFVRFIDTFKCWEHSYLVEEFIDGEHLGRFIVRSNPIFLLTTSSENIASYLQTMRPIWVQVARAIMAAHARNIVLGDLSFTNVLLDDGQVRICDLETAVEEGVDALIGLTTPETWLAGVSPRANDFYALGALIFGSLMLWNGVVGLMPAARTPILRDLAEDLGLPDALVQIVHQLIGDPEQASKRTDKIIVDLEALSFDHHSGLAAPRLSRAASDRMDKTRLRRLRADATTTLQKAVQYWDATGDISRSDRLFPADLMVFETNPMSVAHGAMGVLYAMHRITGEVRQDFLDWALLQSVDRTDYSRSLYLGTSGIAWVFAELGYLDKARATMAVDCGNDSDDDHVPGVLHGDAGYGLACLHLLQRTGDKHFLQEARRIGERLKRTHLTMDTGVCWQHDGSIPVGYAHGASGVSMFLLALANAIDDKEMGQLSHAALRFDLKRAIWEDETLAGFPALLDMGLEAQSPVIYSYWGQGTAGIGSALVAHLRAAHDADLMALLGPMTEETTRKYTAFPQLFSGGAGLGNFLLDAFEVTADDEYLLRAWHVAEGILLCKIEREEGIVFPGEQARRESADYATGSAGICLFLDRLLKSEKAPSPNFNFVPDAHLCGISPVSWY